MSILFQTSNATARTDRMVAPTQEKRYFMHAYMSVDNGLDAKSRAPASKPAGTWTVLSSGCICATVWAALVKSPAIHVTK